MPKQTIEIEKRFTVGENKLPPEKAVPQQGPTPWQEFRNNPLDFILSMMLLTVAGVTMFAVVCVIAVGIIAALNGIGE